VARRASELTRFSARDDACRTGHERKRHRTPCSGLQLRRDPGDASVIERPLHRRTELRPRGSRPIARTRLSSMTSVAPAVSQTAESGHGRFSANHRVADNDRGTPGAAGASRTDSGRTLQTWLRPRAAAVRLRGVPSHFTISTTSPLRPARAGTGSTVREGRFQRWRARVPSAPRARPRGVAAESGRRYGSESDKPWTPRHPAPASSHPR
jgi:hypothetical protein